MEKAGQESSSSENSSSQSLISTSSTSSRIKDATITPLNPEAHSESDSKAGTGSKVRNLPAQKSSSLCSEYRASKIEKKTKRPWKPHLKSFHLFPKLPTEIRQMIWNQTLPSRVLEIQFGPEHGFYTLAIVPSALRVCQGSRSAVIKYYHLSFGNYIYPSKILFNGSLDTLFFGNDVQIQLGQFVGSLKENELQTIQYMVIDAEIDVNWETGGEEDYLFILKKAAKKMPKIKEFRVVVQLDENYHSHGVPCGTGPMELHEKIPYAIRKDFCKTDIICCNCDRPIRHDKQTCRYGLDCYSECWEPAKHTWLLRDLGIEDVNKDTVWGWRRV